MLVKHDTKSPRYSYLSIQIFILVNPDSPSDVLDRKHNDMSGWGSGSRGVVCVEGRVRRFLSEVVGKFSIFLGNLS